MTHEVGTISREERGDGWLGLGFRALDILHIVDAVTVGSVTRERGIGAETVLVDVQGNVFGQLAMARYACVAGHTHQITCGLVGDDVDDTGNGVRTVERRGGTVEHLDALHTCHVDAVQVDIIGDVTRQFLTVDEYQDILVAQSIEPQEGTHRVRCHRHLGHHAGQGAVKCGDALLLDFLAAEHMDGGGGGFQSLMVTRSGHDHRI